MRGTNRSQSFGPGGQGRSGGQSRERMPAGRQVKRWKLNFVEGSIQKNKLGLPNKTGF